MLLTRFFNKIIRNYVHCSNSAIDYITELLQLTGLFDSGI